MPTFRGKPPYVMSEMIAAEPALAERLLRRLAKDDALATLATRFGRRPADGRAVLTTGCGTSEHAAMGIAALRQRGARPARRARSPGRSRARGRCVDRPLTRLLVAISHEGGTRATNEALRAARAAGATTALITVGGRVARRRPGRDRACRPRSRTRAGATPSATCRRSWSASSSPPASRTRDPMRPPSARSSTSARTPGRRRIGGRAGGIDRLLVVGGGRRSRDRAGAGAEGRGGRAPAQPRRTSSRRCSTATSPRPTRWTGLVLIDTDAAGPAFVRERSDRVLAAARSLGMTGPAIFSESPIRRRSPKRKHRPGASSCRIPGAFPALAGSLLSSAIALQLLTERLARARGVEPRHARPRGPAQAAAHA